MKMKKREVFDVFNMLCRICGGENKNCIPVFGESGRRQKIHKKISTCLHFTVEETDKLPKQICLACLHKLDATYEFAMMSKNTQSTLALKLAALSKNKDHEDLDKSGEVDSLCGVCNLEVQEHHQGAQCDGACNKWYHCKCVKMSQILYHDLVNDICKTWFCHNCKNKQQILLNHKIEEKIKSLSERQIICFGESATITLAPSSSPPPSETKDATTTVASALAPVAAPAHASSILAPPVVPAPETIVGVLPAQDLIVSSAPVNYVQSSGASIMTQASAPLTYIQSSTAGQTAQPVTYIQPSTVSGTMGQGQPAQAVTYLQASTAGTMTQAPGAIYIQSATTGNMAQAPVPVSYMQVSTAGTMAQPQTAQSQMYIQPTTIGSIVHPQVVQAPRMQHTNRARRGSAGRPRQSVPLPKPLPVSRQSHPLTPRRQMNNDLNVPQPKKSFLTCKYCNRSFPEDIIDHHVNLHLRQSFFTCLDCNKNFRSELAMSRHRCGVNDSSDAINLDPDDEPICL